MMNLTDKLVETLYTLHSRPLTPELELEARRCLYDEIACFYAGLPVQRDKIEQYLDCFEGNDATVYGIGRKASMQNAALCNAIIAHACDFDDGHRFSTVHLGSTTIIPLLAVCEKENLTMTDLLRGIVIGYEASIRLGRCVQPAHRARGYHSTGTVGTVGAAMGVASALNLSKEQFKTALAAAFTSAAGINEMMENVSTLKPFNAGRAAHDGITAAYIARSGFIGPLDPIGGKFGWLKGACEKYDEKVLTLEFDDGYNIFGCYHKPYAACRHTHAAVYASIKAVEACGASYKDIEKVDVRMYGQGLNGHDHTDIPSVISGKMSGPYCIALALKTGDVGLNSFTEENIKDEEILALTKKTSVTENPEFTALVPHKRAAEATVYLKNGESSYFKADYAPGEPEIPMTIDDFRAKLAGASELTEEQRAALDDAILNGNGKVQQLIDCIV